MKPMLFNTEMVRAILEGRKTVTRRVVKFMQGKNPNWTGYVKDGLTLYNGTNEPCNMPAPYKVNDVLYVRETFCWCPCWDCGNDTLRGCRDKTAEKFYNTDRKEWGCYGYKASFEDDEQPFDKWKPSIHMLREAARIFLKVTGVRVERLQDMSTKEDFKKEGIYDDGTYPTDRSVKRNPMAQGGWTLGAYKDRFEMIWNSTIKKDQLNLYSWEANPYVWVIEFERISKEQAYELDQQQS